MPRLTLFPIDRNLDPAIASPESSVSFSVGQNEELVRQVVRATLALYDRSPRCEPWICYLAVDFETNLVVGTCGFKAGPAGGAVEVAYFTFPQFERRGYATTMAKMLIDVAKQSEQVTIVAAETAPEANASTRILEKLSFARVGERVDEDIGRAWRWERPADGIVPDARNYGSTR